MPAYNAADHIADVVERIPSELWEKIYSFWIINDGSQDQTDEVIQSLEGRHAVIKHVSFSHNRGYGCAVKEGLERCKEDDSEYAPVSPSSAPLTPPLSRDSSRPGRVVLLPVRGAGRPG